MASRMIQTASKTQTGAGGDQDGDAADQSDTDSEWDPWSNVYCFAASGNAVYSAYSSLRVDNMAKEAVALNV